MRLWRLYKRPFLEGFQERACGGRSSVRWVSALSCQVYFKLLGQLDAGKHGAALLVATQVPLCTCIATWTIRVM